jgi:hypothetical protein
MCNLQSNRFFNDILSDPEFVPESEMYPEAGSKDADPANHAA